MIAVGRLRDLGIGTVCVKISALRPIGSMTAAVRLRETWVMMGRGASGAGMIAAGRLRHLGIGMVCVKILPSADRQYDRGGPPPRDMGYDGPRRELAGMIAVGRLRHLGIGMVCVKISALRPIGSMTAAVRLRGTWVMMGRGGAAATNGVGFLLRRLARGRRPLVMAMPDPVHWAAAGA